MEVGVNTLTSHEINCLGQAIERTWGRSSYTGAPSYPGSVVRYPMVQLLRLRVICHDS